MRPTGGAPPGRDIGHAWVDQAGQGSGNRRARAASVAPPHRVGDLVADHPPDVLRQALADLALQFGPDELANGVLQRAGIGRRAGLGSRIGIGIERGTGNEIGRPLPAAQILDNPPEDSRLVRPGVPGVIANLLANLLASLLASLLRGGLPGTIRGFIAGFGGGRKQSPGVFRAGVRFAPGGVFVPTGSFVRGSFGSGGLGRASRFGVFVGGGLLRHQPVRRTQDQRAVIAVIAGRRRPGRFPGNGAVGDLRPVGKGALGDGRLGLRSGPLARGSATSCPAQRRARAIAGLSALRVRAPRCRLWRRVTVR